MLAASKKTGSGLVPVRACPFRVRALRPPSAEEARFAVSFGLDPVVEGAERLAVDVGGQPTVGDGVDVIVLEVGGFQGTSQRVWSGRWREKPMQTFCGRLPVKGFAWS